MYTSDFINTFRPYRGKFSRQESCINLFGENDWITIRKYLSNRVIKLALEGIMTVAWYQNTIPNILGIDVDDHTGTAWNGGKASLKILKVYSDILRLYPLPSFVIQSPRGLHLYWVLQDRVPAVILFNLAKKQLSHITCEIRPTVNTSLRIPQNNRFLDPNNLLPMQFTPNETRTYHPAYLFSDQFLPSTVRETLHERKLRLAAFRQVTNLENIESLYTPITDGSSNEALLALIPVYKKAKLSVEEVVYRISLILQQSPLYTGELRRNPDRLEQRVRSFYKTSRNDFVITPRAQQLSFYNDALVRELVRLSPFSNQRETHIKRFLEKVMFWCDWHDDILQNSCYTSYFDYLYPFYRLNRKRGYYPIPSSVLKKANSHYPSIIRWLIDIGFLEPAPFKYSPNGGICKYYKINREMFIGI